MKLRWREHEFIMATVLCATAIGLRLRDLITMNAEEIYSRFAAPFIEQGRPFSFSVNILFPLISQFLLLYLAYLAVAFVIIPSLRKMSWTELSIPFIKRFGIVILKITTISYLLALGVNALTALGRPHLFNYGLAGFDILALFGYNDQPLKNPFTGFDRAFDLVAVFTIFGGLREIIFHYIDRDNAGRSYRILITNQITSFVALYVALVPVILYISNHGFPGLSIFYFSFIPPTLLVIMINLHWLFPSKEISPFSMKMALRLLVSTLLCIAPFALGHTRKEFYFALLWSLELFVVTPVSWLIYRQNKDKILHLRGLEKELEKSSAELDSLRSQINPHFLFNILNALYGTALLEKSPRTAEGIQKLGDMMRVMLHQNNMDFVSMRNETEHLKNYIALQKLRIQSAANVTIEEYIEEVLYDHDIAPMLLIPLVENAFKHGISLSSPSWITIRLTCAEGTTELVVRNSLHKQRNDTRNEKSGLGLNNIKKRLQLIYADKHHLYAGVEENEFVAKLSIQH